MQRQGRAARPGTVESGRGAVRNFAASAELADRARAEVAETPFKFERRDYLTDILQAANWREIDIQAFDARVSSGNIDAMTTVLTRVGALGQILRGNRRSCAEPKPRCVLARTGDAAISLTAACWIVVAGA